MMKRRQETTERIPSPWRLAGLEPNSPVLLALSGGADSVCLFRLLLLDSQRYGYPLTVAHVEHGIRGEESKRDEAFCRALAESFGVPVRVLHADVPSLAKAHGRSVEEEAREVRYSFFASVMKEEHIPILATAHHADDQLETLLFRLARGCGARGLSGIPVRREFEGGVIVRPLLETRKGEILSYLSQIGQTYVTDSTNQNADYSRNRIRGEVVPVLDSLYPGVSSRAAETASDLASDDAYLRSLAEGFLQTHRSDGGIPTAELNALPSPIRRRAIALSFERFSSSELERVHLSALESLCASSVPHARLSLPAKTLAAIENRCLVFLPDGEECNSVGETVPFFFGKRSLGGGVTLEISTEARKIHRTDTEDTVKLSLSSDKIKSGCYSFRPRKEKDRLLLGGMHRPVRKLYCEKSIPLPLRKILPLLAEEDGVLYVPFVGVADRTDAPSERPDVTAFVTVTLS